MLDVVVIFSIHHWISDLAMSERFMVASKLPLFCFRAATFSISNCL